MVVKLSEVKGQLAALTELKVMDIEKEIDSMVSNNPSQAIRGMTMKLSAMPSEEVRTLLIERYELAGWSLSNFKTESGHQYNDHESHTVFIQPLEE